MHQTMKHLAGYFPKFKDSEKKLSLQPLAKTIFSSPAKTDDNICCHVSYMACKKRQLPFVMS